MSKSLFAIVLVLAVAHLNAKNTPYLLMIVGTSNEELSEVMVGKEIIIKGDLISYQFCNHHTMSMNTGSVISTKMACPGARSRADAFVTKIMLSNINSMASPNFKDDGTFKLRDLTKKQWIQFIIEDHIDEEEA